MKIKRTLAISGLVVATVVAGSMFASADEMRGGGMHGGEVHGGEVHGGEVHGGEVHGGAVRGGWHGGDWHGARGPWHGDFRHFDRHDMRIWRGGVWRQSWHDGRFGWWWIAGGDWFFYPVPVYPYPDPYAYVPLQTVVVQPQPPQTIAPQPAQQLWYYCDSAKGYYPYVATCPSGWRAVPGAHRRLLRHLRLQQRLPRICRARLQAMQQRQARLRVCPPLFRADDRSGAG